MRAVSGVPASHHRPREIIRFSLLSARPVARELKSTEVNWFRLDPF